MAYHGYIKVMKKALDNIEFPNVIEIGVDKGPTLLSLVQYLSRTKKAFNFDAIDILLNYEVDTMLQNFVLDPSQCVNYVIKNSLDFLQEMQTSPEKIHYDLALVDGDHNYFTVQRELELLAPLMAPTCAIFCDDYNGRWADRDLFYATREGYEEVKIATQPIETEKHGVKAAVDDFVKAHPEWELTVTKNEPAILSRGVTWKKIDD